MRRVALACSLALSLVAPGRTALAAPCPNIMLVLDQSGSMAQDPDGHDPSDPAFEGTSKWQLLQTVIVDVVQQYGDRVPFGLELFSTDAWNDQYKCEQAAMITVPLSHAGAGDIIKAIKAAKPLSETDTGEAIKKAASDPSLMSTAKPDYIILVTDGDPNCNPDDAQAVAQGEAPSYTIGQIAAAAAQKPPVRTFVIGFDGSGVNPENLDAMAGAGGERVAACQGSTQGSPCYYRAGANAQQFKDVFDTIVSTAGGGEFGGALCDDSCYSLGCPKGQVCTTTETNPDPHCEPDPCGGASCSGSQFCRGGGCVSACKSGCGASQACVDGTCVANPCAGVSCGGAQVCNPATGACIASPCATCEAGGVCDVASGHCVADQCKIINCPSGTTCVDPVGGNCAKGPGSGCHAGSPAGVVDGAGLAALALAAVALSLAIRRRRA